MPYSVRNSAGKVYFLHETTATLRNGRKRQAFYFATRPGRNTAEELPPGYRVYESWRTGQPYLKKLVDGVDKVGPGSRNGDALLV